MNCVNKSSEEYKSLVKLYGEHVAVVINDLYQNHNIIALDGNDDTGYIAKVKIADSIMDVSIASLAKYIESSQLTEHPTFSIEQTSEATHIIASNIAAVYNTGIYIDDNSDETISYSSVTKQQLLDNPDWDIKTQVINKLRSELNTIKTRGLANEAELSSYEELLSELEEKSDAPNNIWNMAKMLYKTREGIEIVEFDEINEQARQHYEENKLTRAFDEVAYSRSTTDSISARVINFLNALPMINEDGTKQLSPLFKMLNYNNSDAIINKIKQELVNIVDIEDMMNRLEMMSIYFPSAKEIKARLEKNPDLQKMFFANFNTTIENSKYVGYNSIGKKLDLLVDEDNKSPEYILSESWISLVNFNIKNSLYDNKIERAKILLAEIGTLTRGKHVDLADKVSKRRQAIGKLAEAYKILGINIPTDTIEYFMKNSGEYDGKDITKVSATLNDAFYDPLRTIIEHYEAKQLDSKYLTGALNKLGRAVVKYTTSFSEIMYTGVDGNKRYLIKHPSLLSDFQKLIITATDAAGEQRLLDYLLEYAKDATFYNEVSGVKNYNSNWLFTQIISGVDASGKADNHYHPGFLKEENGELILNKDFISKFQSYIFGGLKNYSQNIGVPYTEISDIDWALGVLANYMDAHRLGVDGNKWIGVPIKSPSDASTTKFMLVPRVKILPQHYQKINNEYILSKSSIAFQLLWNVFKQEIGRMRNGLDVLVEKDEGGKYKTDSSGNYILKPVYDKNSEEYSQLAVNALPAPLFRNKNGNIMERGKLVGNIFKFHHFPKIEELDIHNLQGIPNLDILYTKREEIKDKIVEQIKERTSLFIQLMKVHNDVLMQNKQYYDGNDIHSGWFDMYLNLFIHNVEYENFFTGTTAEYQNEEDNNKRAGMPLKHGITIFPRSDEKVKYVIAKDPKITSIILDKLSELITNKLKELGINPDTPEFESSHASILSGYENIVIADAQTFINTRFAIDVLTGRGTFREVEHLIQNGEVISAPKDALASIEVFKPIIVERGLESIEGVNMVLTKILKRSDFVGDIDLGTELKELLDELRDAGIQELVFESAVKGDLRNQVEIVDSHGNLLRNNIPLLLDSVMEYSKHSYRLQQEVSSHIHDETNKLGRQVYKHMFANLALDAEYENGMTGKEIFDEAQSLFEANIKDSAMRLYADLGIIANEDGYIMPNNKKLSEFLYKHGKRQGFSQDELKSLELDIKGDFVMPLTYTEFIDKWMSAIGSIITNKIVNQRFPGMHLVAVSNVFQKATSEEKGKLVKLSDTEYAKSMDRLTSYIEGNTIVMQVAIPAWSKDFINEDGSVIDIKDLPEDLRTMVAYRIPHSAKHSSVIVKVVKILPVSVGSIIIAPDEIVGKLGMDFDVDSLFLMIKKHRRTNNKFESIPFDTSEKAINKEKIKRFLRNHPTSKQEYDDLLSGIKEAINLLRQHSLREELIAALDDISFEHIEAEDMLDELADTGTEEEISAAQEMIDIALEKYQTLSKLLDSIEEVDARDAGIKLKQLLAEKVERDERYVVSHDYYYPNSTPIELASTSGRNNRLLDLYKTILSSEHHTIENIKPAEFSRSESVAAKHNKKHNSISCCPVTQFVYRSKANIGKQVLELSAAITANTTILQNAKAKLLNGISIPYTESSLPFSLSELKEMYGDENVSKVGNIINITYTRIGRNKNETLYNTFGKDRIIIDELGQLVDHAADAVKKELLANLTTYTASVYQVMQSLGIPMEYAGALIAQPVIHEYNLVEGRLHGIRVDIRPFAIRHSVRAKLVEQLYREYYSKTKDDFSNLYVSDFRNELPINKMHFQKGSSLDAILAKLEAKMGNPFKDKTSFTLEDLESPEVKASKFAQLVIFDKFLSYKSGAVKTITQYNMILGVDKTGMTPKFEIARNLVNKIVDLGTPRYTTSGDIYYPYTLISEVTNGRLEQALYPSAFNSTAKSVYPMLDAWLKFGYVIPLDIFSSYFITENPDVLDLYDSILSIYPGFKYDSVRNNRAAGLFRKKVMNSILGSHAIFNKPQEEIDILIGRVKVEGFKSIPERIIEAREILNLDINQVHLLNWIQPQLSIRNESRLNYQQIHVQNAKGLEYDSIFQKNFLDMFNSPDPRLQDLAVGLLQYLHFTKGMMFSYNTYARYIPLSVKLQLGLGNFMQNALNEVNNGDLTSIGDNIISEFILDNIDNDLIWQRARGVDLSQSVNATKLKDLDGIRFITRTTKEGTTNPTFTVHKYIISEVKETRSGVTYKYENVTSLYNNLASNDRIVAREAREELLHKIENVTGFVDEQYDERSRDEINDDAEISETITSIFKGYKGGYEDIGKGTSQGDGKDKAMRKVADGFIGEVKRNKANTSSTGTSFKEIRKKAKDDKFIEDIGILNLESPEEVQHGVASVWTIESPNEEGEYIMKVAMLARNGEFKGQPLFQKTKDEIDLAHASGAEFVVGDMPNVDSQFIEYLQEIGATFTIYHTGSTPRITVSQQEGKQLDLFDGQEERSTLGSPMNKQMADRQAAELTQMFAELGVEVEVRYDETVPTHRVQILDGKAVILLNPNRLRTTSVFHEFGHVLLELIEDDNFIEQGVNQLKDTQLWKDIAELYPELSEKHLGREVLTTAIGIEADILFTDKEQQSKFKFWLNRLFDRLSDLLFRISRGTFGKELSVAKKLALKLVNTSAYGRLKEKIEYKEWEQRASALEQAISSNVAFVEERMNILTSQKMKYRENIRNFQAWKYNAALTALEKDVDVPAISKLLDNIEDEEGLLAMAKGVNKLVVNDIKWIKSIRAKLEQHMTRYYDKYTKGNELTFEEGIELGKDLDGIREFFEIYGLIDGIDIMNNEALLKDLASYPEKVQVIIKEINNTLSKLKTADFYNTPKMKRDYLYLRDTIHKAFIISHTTNDEVQDYLSYFNQYNFDENFKQLMFGALIHSNNPLAANLARMIRLADNRVANEFRAKNKEFYANWDRFIKAGGNVKHLYNEYGELHKQWLYEKMFDDIARAMNEEDIPFYKALARIGTPEDSNILEEAITIKRRLVSEGKLSERDYGRWFNKNIQEGEYNGETIYYAKITGQYFTPFEQYENKQYSEIMNNTRDKEMYQYLEALMLDLFSEYSTIRQKTGLLPAMFSKEALRDKKREIKEYKKKKEIENAKNKVDAETDAQIKEVTNVYDERNLELKLNYVGYLMEQPTVNVPKRKDSESQEVYEKRVVDLANNFKPEMQFKSIKDVKEYNRKITKENKERHGQLVNYDLPNVIPAFIKATLHFKEYKEIEGTVLTTLVTLKENKVRQKRNGKTVVDAFKKVKGVNKYVPKEGETNVYAHARDFIRMVYYGQFNASETKLDKALDNFKNYRAFTSMGLNFFSATKNITYGGFMTAMEGVAGTHFSINDMREVELMYDKNFHSFLNDVHLRKDKHSASTYVGALIKRFNIIESYNDIMERTPDADRHYLYKLANDVAFFMQEKGEHMMQNKLLLAMMNSHRIVNGKLHTINSYLREYDLTLTKEEKDLVKAGKTSTKEIIKEKKKIRDIKKEEFKKYTKLINAFEYSDGYAELKKEFSELTSEEIDTFRMKVQAVSHKLHGIYNKADKGTIEQYRLGQHLMQFRHWAIPGWDKRYGARGGLFRIDSFWDEMMQEKNIGDYKAFAKFISMGYKDVRQEYIADGKTSVLYTPLIVMQGLRKLIGNTMTYWYSMDSYERAGAKRAVSEYAAIAMVSLLTWAALAKLEADDDEESRLYNFMLVQLDASKTELKTFLPVVGWLNEGLKIMQNPTATFSLMMDIWKLLGTIFEYPFVDEEDRYFKGGYYHGRSKIGIRSSRVIPGGNIWRRWEALDQQKKAYKLYGN